MLHKTLEAKATVTDLGEFTAIAAAYSVDRTSERILPGAFKATIERWQGSGKQIPLHWDHSAAPEDIIGTVEPSSMRETDEGLEIKGQLDLDESEVAREAWRSMKKNRVGLSFGYLVTDAGKGKDGVRELKAVDLFEVTITPAPMNPDTRFIDMKSTTATTAGGSASISLHPRAPTFTGALPVAFPGDELEGAREGELKAVWTTAFINDLPDSAFLYVESGEKDSEGKTTPRSKRHFPYKNAEGKVDLPHLRNALSRIPQSNLSQDVKDRLTSKAQSILDKQKQSVEDACGEDPLEGKPEAQDPLRKHYDDLAELSLRGIEPSEPPKVEEKAPEKQFPSVDELRRSYYDERYEEIERELSTRGVKPSEVVQETEPPTTEELRRTYYDLMLEIST